MPTVSALMPVYNAEPYLAEAVESILGQTFADFEFLIVNDGSTDRSGAILERYAARDRRIRLTSRPNTGYTVALNQLLDLASGEFVARMDADDVALPQRLARQVDYLRAHPDVVCVGSAVHMIDAAGRFLRNGHPGMDHEAIQQRALAGDCPLNHPSVMMRRAAVEAVGGYHAEFEPAEDLDLWLRLGEVGRLVNLPEVLMKYRQHVASFSEQYQRLQLERSAAAVLETCLRRGIPPRNVVVSPWRPVDRRSRMQTYVGYGCRGLERNDYRMALHYGLQAIRQVPWRAGGWWLLARLLRRLLVRDLLGRSPRPPASDAEP
jgi:glycosyltransferase involved in cell wall biosynthesis